MKIGDILTDKTRWTQGALARNKAGDPVHYSHGDAIAYCLVGAMLKAYTGAARAAAFCAADATIGYKIVNWNDSEGRTFDDVRKVMEIADAAAEAAGKEKL